MLWPPFNMRLLQSGATNAEYEVHRTARKGTCFGLQIKSYFIFLMMDKMEINPHFAKVSAHSILLPFTRIKETDYHVRRW